MTIEMLLLLFRSVGMGLGHKGWSDRVWGFVFGNWYLGDVGLRDCCAYIDAPPAVQVDGLRRGRAKG